MMILEEAVALQLFAVTVACLHHVEFYFVKTMFEIIYM